MTRAQPGKSSRVTSAVSFPSSPASDLSAISLCRLHPLPLGALPLPSSSPASPPQRRRSKSARLHPFPLRRSLCCRLSSCPQRRRRPQRRRPFPLPPPSHRSLLLPSSSRRRSPFPIFLLVVDFHRCRRFPLFPPLLLCDGRQGLLSPFFLCSCRRFPLFSLSSFATGTSVAPLFPYSPAPPRRLLYLAASHLPALPRRLLLPQCCLDYSSVYRFIY